MRLALSVFCWLLLSTILVFLADCAHMPIGFWARNRFNHNDQRHGPWRGYLDIQEHPSFSKGRYRYGCEVGR